MIERLRSGYLKPLHYASSYTMTIIATQTFVSVVLRMTETNAKSGSHLACTYVATRFMTNATRRNAPIP